MAYVDSNPVRAAMTDDTATSDSAYIQLRLFEYAKYKSIKIPVEKTYAKRVKKQKQLKGV